MDLPAFRRVSPHCSCRLKARTALQPRGNIGRRVIDRLQSDTIGLLKQTAKDDVGTSSGPTETETEDGRFVHRSNGVKQLGPEGERWRWHFSCHRPLVKHVSCLDLRAASGGV